MRPCSLGIFRYRLINILPIARDIVFDNIQDGMLVLDLKNCIVDVKPAAQKYTRATSQNIGSHVDTIIKNWPELFDGEESGNNNLESGDCILMYTDGTYEAMKISTREMFGMDKLEEVFIYNIMHTAKDLLNSIMAEIFNFINYKKLDDDVSMILIKKECPLMLLFFHNLSSN